jgi:ABC-type uncharacterized transport system permease subunit
MEHIVELIALTLAAGTPLVFAATGELVVEKSGVLNLGVEGMMLVGAVAAFITASTTGSAWAGVLMGMLAGALLALCFGVLTLTLMANQVATGLALALFGNGLSAFVGKPYAGVLVAAMSPLHLGALSDVPFVGKLLFGLNPLVYFSLALVWLVHWFLYRTQAGLVLRAVGEAPVSAHAIGLHVVGIRYASVAFGGACAGIAGAYLAVAFTPLWAEGMTAGRGWIALALVVFATWKPARLLLGAYLFGGVTLAQFQAQALGADISSEILSMLPYVATIIVLAAISRDARLIRLNAPASLGKPFRAE